MTSSAPVISSNPSRNRLASSPVPTAVYFSIPTIWSALPDAM